MSGYCTEPFIHAEISSNGSVRLCCASWHPKVVGNINNTSLEEIWTGNEAIKVRNSINDLSYTYCKLDICPSWQSNRGFNKHTQAITTKLPKRLKFSFDHSCNLECPSCRSSKIQHVKGSKEYNYSMSILNKIKESYYNVGSEQEVIFVITGSGDPFGSNVFRNFLYDLDGTKLPLLKLLFLTNGVMLTDKVVNKIYKIHKNIFRMHISIDAATEKTYNIVRKGGNFNQLKKNIEHIHLNPNLQHVIIYYSFVVQNANFLEMIDFAKWILSYPKANIRFTKLLPWNDMGIDYENENIFNTNHINYNKFKSVLKDPIFLSQDANKRIDWTNINVQNILNSRKGVTNGME